MDQRNTGISTRGPIVVPAEVHERDVVETPNVLASTAVTAPDILDVEPRGTSSPRISLPKGSPSRPTVTATCRPRTWMQQILKGRSMSLGERMPALVKVIHLQYYLMKFLMSLGHEWRVLYPFELLE